MYNVFIRIFFSDDFNEILRVIRSKERSKWRVKYDRYRKVINDWCLQDLGAGFMEYMGKRMWFMIYIRGRFDRYVVYVNWCVYFLVVRIKNIVYF